MQYTSTIMAFMAIFGAHTTQCMPFKSLELHTPESTSAPNLNTAILNAISQATRIPKSSGPSAKVLVTKHDTFMIWFGTKKSTFDIYGANWDTSLRDGKHQGSGLKDQLEKCGSVSDWKGDFNQDRDWDFHVSGKIMSRSADCVQKAVKDSGGPDEVDVGHQFLLARDISARSEIVQYYAKDGSVQVSTMPDSDSPTNTASPESAAQTVAVEYYEPVTGTVKPKLVFDEKVAWAFEPIDLNKPLVTRAEGGEVLKKTLPEFVILTPVFIAGRYFVLNWLGAQKKAAQQAAKTALDMTRGEEVANLAESVYNNAYDLLIRPDATVHGLYEHGHEGLDHWVEEQVKNYIKSPGEDASPVEAPSLESLESLAESVSSEGEYLGSDLFNAESQGWDWMFDVSDSFSHLSEDSITTLNDAMADAFLGKFNSQWADTLTDMNARVSNDDLPGTPEDPATPDSADPPTTPDSQPGTSEPIDLPDTPVSRLSPPDTPDGIDPNVSPDPWAPGDLGSEDSIPGHPYPSPDTIDLPNTPVSHFSPPDTPDRIDPNVSPDPWAPGDLGSEDSIPGHPYPSPDTHGIPDSPALEPGVASPMVAPPVIAPPIVAPPVVAPPVVAPPMVAPPVLPHDAPSPFPALWPHGDAFPFPDMTDSGHHNSGNEHQESGGEHHEEGEEQQQQQAHAEQPTASATTISTTSAPQSTTMETTTASETQTSTSTSTSKTSTSTSTSKSSTSSPSTSSTSTSTSTQEEPTSTSTTLPTAPTSTTIALPHAALHHTRTGKHKHHKYAFSLDVVNLPAFERTPTNGVQSTIQHLRSGIEKCGDLDSFNAHTKDDGETLGWDFKIDGVIKGTLGKKKHFALGCFREAIMAAGGPGDIEGI